MGSIHERHNPTPCREIKLTRQETEAGALVIVELFMLNRLRGVRFLSYNLYVLRIGPIPIDPISRC